MKKLVLFWILIFSFQLFAQSEFGSIKGVVTDPTGAVIPNVQVKAIPIIDSKIIVEKSLFANSNADGEFNYQNIPIGFYELQIRVSWSEIVVKKRVNITNNKTTQTDLGFITYIIEGCSDVSETKDLTTDKGKSAIVREMLKSENRNGKSKLILSIENTKVSWLGNKERQIFTLMKPLKSNIMQIPKEILNILAFQFLKLKENV